MWQERFWYKCRFILVYYSVILLNQVKSPTAEMNKYSLTLIYPVRMSIENFARNAVIGESDSFSGVTGQVIDVVVQHVRQRVARAEDAQLKSLMTSYLGWYSEIKNIT